MKILKRILFVPCFMAILFGGAVSAQADTYHSKTHGYTLEVPADWFELSEGNIDFLLDQETTFMPREAILNLKNEVTSGKVTAFYEKLGDQMGVGNIVITVENGSPEMTDQFKKNVADSILDSLKQSGLKDVKLVASKLIKLKERPVVLTELEYSIDYGDELVKFHNIQYVIPGKGKHFAMGCTALDKDFSQYLPLFEEVFSSFVIS